jgi:hypothetical protein
VFTSERPQFAGAVGYATTNDPTTNECYSEQYLSIKSGCYNDHRLYSEREAILFIMDSSIIFFTRERLFMLFDRESLFIVFTKESLFMLLQFTRREYEI